MAKAFIATLGIGKGTWGHVARLISEGEWDKVVLISNEWGKENFKISKDEEENAKKLKNSDWAIVNTNAGFDTIKDVIKDKLPSGDVHVSLISGSGKEHMAVLAALKESGTNFKLITLTGDGTKTY
ncbi:MAG: hypothetical protein V1672_02075 [Candidatus Diapherotrites archaeon]